MGLFGNDIMGRCIAWSQKNKILNLFLSLIKMRLGLNFLTYKIGQSRIDPKSVLVIIVKDCATHIGTFSWKNFLFPSKYILRNYYLSGPVPGRGTQREILYSLVERQTLHYITV